MPSYRWRCLSCAETQPATADRCGKCGCPAYATYDEIAAARRPGSTVEDMAGRPRPALRIPNPFHRPGRYVCPACGSHDVGAGMKENMRRYLYNELAAELMVLPQVKLRFRCQACGKRFFAREQD